MLSNDIETETISPLNVRLTDTNEEEHPPAHIPENSRLYVILDICTSLFLCIFITLASLWIVYLIAYSVKDGINKFGNY
jgi:hypothetical protein